MLVPQSLAYASLMGVNSSLGLQSGFFPLLIYFFFGTSRQVSMGPEAIVAILTSTLMDAEIGDVDAGTDAQKEATLHLRTIWAPVIAGMIGFNLLILGLFRLGFLVQMFSRALLSGFINAVAIHIILEQLGNLIDVTTKGHSFGILLELYHLMPTGSTTAMIMAFCCLGWYFNPSNH